MALLGKTFTETDIASNKLGKMKRYTLPRAQLSINFKGKLLSFYREDAENSGQITYMATYVDTIALFKTEKEQYLVYYQLNNVEDNPPTNRKSHVKVLSSLAEVESFLQRMQYANKNSYHSIILSDARKFDV